MQSDPERSKNDKSDPLKDVVHDPDEQRDPSEKVEEDGEPFDGNFA